MPRGSLKFTPEERKSIDRETLAKRIKEMARDEYHKREELNTPEVMRDLERIILLRVVDAKWRDHIDAMSQLRDGMNLRAYANRDPVIEYQKESFEMFDEMTTAIQHETLKMLFNVVVKNRDEMPVGRRKEPENMKINRTSDGTVINEPNKTVTTVVAKKTPGRNEPCPCGSGKKYKNCCGAHKQAAE